MTSLSFRRRDIIILLGIAVVAVAATLISHNRGAPLSPIPLIGLATAIASVLTDAYYNAKRLGRDLEQAALEKSTPISVLREIVIRDLLVARKELAKVRARTAELEVANAIGQLDRESVLAILRTVSRPTKREVWADRFAGFLLGVASSLVAGYMYSALQAGSNA